MALNQNSSYGKAILAKLIMMLGSIYLGVLGGHLITVDAPQTSIVVVLMLAGLVGTAGSMWGTGETKGDNSCDCS